MPTETKKVSAVKDIEVTANATEAVHVFASIEQLLISSLIFVPSATLDSGSAPQGEALCELEADRRHHQDQGALEAQQGLPVGTLPIKHL